MGATDSKQKLGERVLAARKKLADDQKMISERVSDIKSQSPETMKVIIQSVAQSFKHCSPFLEPTLLLAWQSDPQQCKNIVLHTCRKVLSAPINKDEYQWFVRYLFPSSIWMFKTKDRYMFEELIDIANNMQKDIIDSMNSIYNHLQYHPRWEQLMKIENATVVSRQDDRKVGLLKQKGLADLEMKQSDNKSDDIKTFIDTNVAINILTSTAKNINREFQNHIKTVMNSFGDFKSGPIKRVDRCVSKLENDYHQAAFPKSAKLLDLVRCSVTFNTVDQLISGYNGLIKHISKNRCIMELARIKNGFIDKEWTGGYRDIKVNVIYHSTINPDVSMICEVQLLLGQYLHEKKRIHKLYSIVRQKQYFNMTVADDDTQSPSKDIRDLEFKEILNIGKEVEVSHSGEFTGRCSVDTQLGLLGMEDTNWFGVIDLKQKKEIYKIDRSTQQYSPSYGYQSHDWITIDGQKYVSMQMSKNEIRMFKVQKSDLNKYKFIDDPKYRITHHNESKDYMTKGGLVNFCAFDQEFNYITIVLDNSMIQKRSMKDVNNIVRCVKLETTITSSRYRGFSLSADGTLCGLGGGENHNYFYVVDIDNDKQQKITSNFLRETYAPCFINGQNEYIAICGQNKMEIWDINKEVSIKKISLQSDWILATASTHNILAIASDDKKLRLFDVRNWQCFYTKQYNSKATSLHLSDDLRYLTFAGKGGDRCAVLQIE